MWGSDSNREAGLDSSLICLQNPGPPASSPNCKVLKDRIGVCYFCIFKARDKVRLLEDSEQMLSISKS